MLTRVITQRASSTVSRTFTSAASAPRAEIGIPKTLIFGAAAAAAIATVYYSIDQEVRVAS